ncbi:hypothetical protein [Breznakiella homolactica]|uniref:Uncharacterized protein n=1 Tax=Breznakiella homolactica TaxID=2798577 RepID=A0A7T7XLN4_9SPIR|nr:hypothetical protein [Breznakiella homolactica]QQO08656.1 hypothetical protein JFL75_17260 [Breznakiella homolactica]
MGWEENKGELLEIAEKINFLAVTAQHMEFKNVKEAQKFVTDSSLVMMRQSQDLYHVVAEMAENIQAEPPSYEEPTPRPKQKKLRQIKPA